MAGHSKWANIKHKKAKADAEKGKIYTKISRVISVAAREGGGDPETNARLKDAVRKAKDVNMPSDNIKRAIKKGIGELEGQTYEETIFEGYGPGGAAILVDVMTDNKNRITSEIRHIFDKFGGSLGELGCVSWIFEKKGIINLKLNNNYDEEEFILEAIESGGEDVRFDVKNVEIITTLEEFEKVKKYFETSKYELYNSEITMIPSSIIELTVENFKKTINLIEALDENDDVQNVYSNFLATDDIIE